MTSEQTYTTFIEPQFDQIRSDLKEMQKSNAKEHSAIMEVVDVLQNGNGQRGLKQLNLEWDEVERRKSSKVENAIKIGLIVFNVVLALAVGKLFVVNKTLPHEQAEVEQEQ